MRARNRLIPSQAFLARIPPTVSDIEYEQRDETIEKKRFLQVKKVVGVIFWLHICRQSSDSFLHPLCWNSSYIAPEQNQRQSPQVVLGVRLCQPTGLPSLIRYLDFVRYLEFLSLFVISGMSAGFPEKWQISLLFQIIQSTEDSAYLSA